MSPLTLSSARCRFLALLVLAAAPAADAQDIPFQRTVVGIDENPWVKMIGDVDGDGLLDVVIGTQAGNLTWHRYPGWTATPIGGGFSSVDGEMADIDGDGDLDIVCGGTAWFENPRPDSAPGARSWERHAIGSFRAHDVEVADLDGDGKLDVVLRDQGTEGDVIRIFQQNGPDTWTARDLSAPEGEGLTLGDIDRDGDKDIIIGGRWYENTGNIGSGAWTAHTFAPAWHPNAVAKMGDLNRDGRPDVVMTSSENLYKLSWFEAPADPRSGPWTEHVVEDLIDSAHGIELFDMDNDGDLDIVTAEWRGQMRVLVYRNNGDGSAWTRQVLSTAGLHNIRVGDFENDGDFDIMGAVPFGQVPVELWLNQTGPRLPFRVLLFTRTAGFRHDSIGDGILAIQALAAQNNFLVDQTEDAGQFTDATLAQYQAVIFLSTTGDVLNDNQQAAFERFIRGGGGFAGIHAASDTEYTWPWYGGLVGAYFRSHPAVQRATIRVENRNHASTEFLPETWVRTDEWYNFQENPRARVQVLATVDETTYSGGDMGDHPIAWWQAYDGGRSWYTAGGHTRESFSEPLFLTHLMGGIKYAAGRAGDPTPVNRAPTVLLTSPVNNAAFTPPASIFLAATAADPDGSIARVEFYAGSTKLGEDTSAPFQFQWQQVPEGGYLLSAIAVDNLGSSTRSDPVYVAVGSGQARPFDTWKASKFTPAQLADPAISGLLADPDGDGLINLVEYASFLEPLEADAVRRPQYAVQRINDDDYLTMSYTQVKSATDLDYAVEVSSDLATWNPDPALTEQISRADHGLTWVVTVRDRTAIRFGTSRFLRVRVTLR